MGIFNLKYSLCCLLNELMKIIANVQMMESDKFILEHNFIMSLLLCLCLGFDWAFLDWCLLRGPR